MKKKKGILFWITGLSGCGKTSLAKKILDFVKKNYGPTIIVNGDDLREIFDYKKFDKSSRLKYALSYSKFCKEITDQKVNVIFSTVSLYHKVRSWNKKNINNYFEIYIEADIKTLIKKKKKYFYRTKLVNIVGKNIKAELPEKPDIKITNNFIKSINQLKIELIKEISLKV
jgi:adenylylsulfate kinase-like enzyme